MWKLFSWFNSPNTVRPSRETSEKKRNKVLVIILLSYRVKRITEEEAIAKINRLFLR